MYFLPFENNTRFAALKDTPEVENYLTTWLSGGRSWEELSADPVLSANIVEGQPILGILRDKDKSLISSTVGRPQVRYKDDPQALLFVFGSYKLVKTNNALSYDKLAESYIRQQISPHSYVPSEVNLQEIKNELVRLSKEKIGTPQYTDIQKMIDNVTALIGKLAKRNDPLSVVMPVIAAESATREAVIQDILTQLNKLQPATATGKINLTNYPTKKEMYDLLSVKTNKGYVDGLYANTATRTELTNHIFDSAIHNPTYIQVGSPSRAEHELLTSRLLLTESIISGLVGESRVKGLEGRGGLLTNRKSDGTWYIDASGIGIGTGDKPQETSWFQDGLLQVETGAGNWRVWEKSQIIGIALTADLPSVGSPIVVDFKKNGVSIYTTTQRPTLPEGNKSILAFLPNDTNLNPGDLITVDIANVGTTIAGADLTIQMRYQYVN